MRHRILYIEPSKSIGGSSLSLYDLVRRLDLCRYEPVLLFYHPHPAIEHFSELGVEVIMLWEEIPAAKPPVSRASAQDVLVAAPRVTIKELLTIAFNVPQALRIAKLIKRKAIDLVHHNSSGLYDGRTDVLAAGLAKTPQVCHVHNLLGFSAIERYLSRFVNAFLYVSRAVEKRNRDLGIPPSKGTLVYNPIDAEPFLHPGDPNQVRVELGLTEDEFVISNVARIDTWRGHDYFLYAMAEVIKSYPNAKALIVGAFTEIAINTGYDQKLQRLITELGLTSNVIFTGFRTDVPQVMAASDMIVHSATLPEGFGRAPAEGLAAGKPVIVTDAGGVLDIIKEGVNGLVVPRKDSKAMAEAILWVLNHPEKAQQMAAAGRQHVIDNFNIEVYVEAVQKVYECVLNGKKNRRAFHQQIR